MIEGFKFDELRSEMSTDKSLIKEWDFITFGQSPESNRIYYKPIRNDDHDLSEGDGFLFYCLRSGLAEHNQELWNYPRFEVYVTAAGYGFFDGIRHLYFHKSENIKSGHTFDGYLYYPYVKDLSDMLLKLRELEEKYCRDCEE